MLVKGGTGNKPLPDPILVPTYVAIWRRVAKANGSHHKDKKTDIGYLSI